MSPLLLQARRVALQALCFVWFLLTGLQTGAGKRAVVSRPPSSDPDAAVRISKSDFEFLSGIRGIAAIVVALRHFCDSQGPWAGLGMFSVWMFFFLSAFLLTFRGIRDPTPLWSSRNDPAPAASFSLSFIGASARFLFNGSLGQVAVWLKYFVRRFLRVWPLFAVCVIAAHNSKFISDNGYWGAYSASTSYWVCFTMQNKLYGLEPAMFWTLRPELTYYLWIPFYVILYRMAECADGSKRAEQQLSTRTIYTERWTANFWIFRGVFLSISCFVSWQLWNHFPLDYASNLTQDVRYYHIVFWSGTLTAIIFDMLLKRGLVLDPNRKQSTRTQQAVSIIGSAVGWLTVIVIFLSDDWRVRYVWVSIKYPIWEFGGPHEGSVYGAYSGVLGALLVLSIATTSQRGRLSRVLSSKLFVRAGDISFSIYASHMVARGYAIHWMDVSPKLGFKGPDRDYFIYFCTWILAELSMLVVEKPCMRLAQRCCHWISRAFASLGSRPSGKPAYSRVGTAEEGQLRIKVMASRK